MTLVFLLSGIWPGQPARAQDRVIDQIIGRTDLIEVKNFDWHWKAKTVDLSKLLHFPA